MNETEINVIGQQLGEHITPLIALIRALRQQPGFDDEHFKKTVLELAERPSLKDHQKQIFLAAISG